MDLGSFKKLALRVEETLTSQCLFPEPKQIDPVLILVAPNNRMGAPPNTRHLHRGVLRSFQKHSFDRTRAAIGICILFTSEQGLKMLIEHNMRFSKGCKLLPPIVPGACYGSLATSHYNLALRCIKAGTFSPIGNLQDLLTDSPNLRDAVEQGHRWWILPETVLKERQVDISLWRNMDQNENQATHEIEILQGIKTTSESLSSRQDKVSFGDLVSISSRKNPAKISVHQMQTLCKVYMGFLENGMPELIQDLIDFHSDTVDPKEIIVSSGFLQSLISEEALKTCPHLRVHLIMGQYSIDKVRAQGSGPAVGALFEPANIVGLVKKSNLLKSVETQIRDLKKKYLPYLEQFLSARQARLEMAVYIDLVLRCLFAKCWPVLEPKITLPVGKYDQAKVETLGRVWAKIVNLKYPESSFAATAGLEEQAEETQEDQQELDLVALRELKRNPSGGPEVDEGPKFSRGDQVTVVRKVTWKLPQKGDPNYRKDLVVGTTGVVEGWADLENRQVLMKVTLDVPDGKKKGVHQGDLPQEPHSDL